MLNYFPKHFTNKAIALYFVTFILITMLFFKHSMAVLMFMIGVLEVITFFYFSNVLTKKWSALSSTKFSKNLFATGFIIRLIWVIFSYFFYIVMTGQPFEFEAADSLTYHSMATDLAEKGFSEFGNIFSNWDLSDRGYGTYLGLVYIVFGKSIFIARVIKALLGAFTVLLIYKLATRNLGENTGRIAAILTMLMPNLIFYCGLHLKEVEMVFISVAFIERADYTLRSKINFTNTFIVLLLAAIMFTFRTALGITALFSLVTALLFSRDKLLGFGQRFIIGVWVVIAIAFFAGGKISTEIEQLWQKRDVNQKSSMEWRAQREGGNKFADKASTLIFAPAIFIIPIPTMVNIETQQNQQLIHGGNFDKDILAFFLIFGFVYILINRKWRNFTLIGAFMLGYLAIIAMSAFAQSERFHQPALPFYLMFAAYGISNITNKEKKYFNAYLVLLLFIVLAWNWFKLAGRGLV